MLSMAKSLLCLSLFSSALGAVTPKALRSSNTLPGGFIVEWEGNSLVDPKAGFYQKLSEHVQATHRLDFRSPIFQGVSFHVDGNVDHLALAKDIKALGVVKDIWPITLYNTQDVKSRYAYMNGTSSNSTVDAYAPHVMGGVDKLHAEGLTGKGIFVAIIDSGIAYTHPALGGGFGPGYKVAYVSDDNDFPDQSHYLRCLPGL